MGTKTLVGCSVMPLVLTGAILAALVWGGATYVGLTREQVGIEEAWTQMENAWLHRRQLIPDLLDAAARNPSVSDATYRGLLDSVDRASRYTVTPELLNDPETCVAFLADQDRLERDLLAFLDRHGERLASAAPSVAERLRTQLEWTDARLDRGRERFNDAVEAYNDSLTRFPERLIADLFDFRVRTPWHPGAVNPAPDPAPRADAEPPSASPGGAP